MLHCTTSQFALHRRLSREPTEVQLMLLWMTHWYARTYDFRVLILKGDRSDSASTRIRVAASNLPVTASLLSPIGPDYKADPHRRLVVQGRVDSLEPVQADWAVFRKFATGAEDVEINVTAFREQRSINEVSLVVPAGSLPVASESVEYTFRLTASGAGGTSYAEMTILVNSAPLGGSVRVDPEQGFAFDTFMLSTAESSWSDDAEDFPLMCRFGYYESHGARETKRRYLTDTALAFVSPPVVLPVGVPPLYNYSVFVQVTDVWGSSSLATTRVQVGQGNATIRDGIAALERTTGIGDIYAAYHVIDALSVQQPEESVVDQMSRSLRSLIEAQAITAVSAARVISTLARVARNDLSDASIDNCIAVVEEVTACARRDGVDLQPCQFARDEVDTLTDAVGDLFSAAQASYEMPGHNRRLSESPSEPVLASAALVRANVLLDMVQVLAGATLSELVSGESAQVFTGAFTMQVHRRQELDYLSQAIPSWSQEVLSISTRVAQPGAASRTVGALVTVWSGRLPFFWDTVSAQPACLSLLTDIEVGNTTRWSRRGVFKTVCEALPVAIDSGLSVSHSSPLVVRSVPGYHLCLPP